MTPPRPECLAHFERLVGYLGRTASDLVLAARWTFRMYPILGHIETLYFENSEGGREKSYIGQRVDPAEARRHTPEAIAAQAQARRRDMERFLEGLVATGRSVVLVYPVPEIGWDITRLNLNHYAVTRRVLDAISIPREDYRQRNAFVLEIFDRIERAGHPNLFTVKPEHVFCDTYAAGRCSAQANGVPFYYDDNHLSDDGARLIVREIMERLGARSSALAGDRLRAARPEREDGVPRQRP